MLINSPEILIFYPTKKPCCPKILIKCPIMLIKCPENLIKNPTAFHRLIGSFQSLSLKKICSAPWPVPHFQRPAQIWWGKDNWQQTDCFIKAVWVRMTWKSLAPTVSLHACKSNPHHWSSNVFLGRDVRVKQKKTGSFPSRHWQVTHRWLHLLLMMFYISIITRIISFLSTWLWRKQSVCCQISFPHHTWPAFESGGRVKGVKPHFFWMKGSGKSQSNDEKR